MQNPFDENALRAEIVRVFGPAGAHVQVYDELISRLKQAERKLEERKLEELED